MLVVQFAIVTAVLELTELFGRVAYLDLAYYWMGFGLKLADLLGFAVDPC